MKKVIVYIDGFNLYHAIDDLKDDSLKWLNLRSLALSFLKNNQTLTHVKYFSAFATWRPDAYARHREYISALKAQNVNVIMGRFKKKHIQCRASCNEEFITHEEKETDVNIGAHLVADAIKGRFDVAFIVSADTDIMGAVKVAKKERPDLKILMVAPPKRKARSREMKHLFEITVGRIRAHRLPDIIELSNGKQVSAPGKYLLPS